MSMSAETRRQRPLDWPVADYQTLSCMAAAFLIALALAVIVLVIFGVGERGTSIALRATARWSFLLFWFAYAAGAIARLFGRISPAWRATDTTSASPLLRLKSSMSA